MMVAPGATATRANTVTLALSQGESVNSTATFSPMMSARQVTLGAGGDAVWKIHAQGVEAVHAELYWDGTVAFVRDHGSHSGVYVGVERVDEWRQLYDGDEVMMGEALLRVRVVGPDAQPPHDPLIAAAAPVHVAPRGHVSQSFLEEESTMIFQGSAAAQAFLNEAPMRTVSAPTMAPMTSLGVIPAPRTTSQETVIRMSPYADLPPTSGEATMMHTDLPAHLLAQPPAVASAHLVPAAYNAMRGPTVSTGNTQTMVTPPQGVGNPPSFADDTFGTIPPPIGSTEILAPKTGIDGFAAKLKTTPRTLAMGSATLLIAVCALAIPPPAPAAQGRSPAGVASAGALTPGLQILTTPAPAPQTNNILQLPLGPSGLVGVILPAPMGGTDAAGHPIPLPVANLNDPIRLAAESVATHHWSDAAPRYETLATLHPEAPLFHHFAIVLRTRMNASTCQPGDPGCVAAPTRPGS